MLKDFKIKKYLNKKPPSNNSTTTKGEITALTKIPIREKFIKEKDDVKKSFSKIVKEEELVQRLINASAPIIMKIKKHHNRPRPKVIAKKLGLAGMSEFLTEGAAGWLDLKSDEWSYDEKYTTKEIKKVHNVL